MTSPASHSSVPVTDSAENLEVTRSRRGHRRGRVRGSEGSFSVSTCLTRSGITTAPRIAVLSSSLSCVISQECNLSTNLEVEQCDNLILIKIWCHDNEGHNDGLSFQSENLYGTTAEEQNLPVNHSKMLIL